MNITTNFIRRYKDASGRPQSSFVCCKVMHGTEETLRSFIHLRMLCVGSFKAAISPWLERYKATDAEIAVPPSISGKPKTTFLRTW